ncbi:MAG: hypothetical protein OEZ06_02990 [Myxococcales bacterium]|nr:hypothetical protein [Myxococcales bacterium]
MNQAMNQAITILAPIKLAPGRTENDLIAASDRFQEQFVRHQPGVLRRELVRRAEGDYLDIIQFRSMDDAEAVMQAERESEVCRAFFEVMEIDESSDASESIDICSSLATYG